MNEGTIGALVVRMGIGGIFYSDYIVRNPHNPILTTEASLGISYYNYNQEPP